MRKSQLQGTIYDPDWYEARLKAYLDEYEGLDVTNARSSFPDLAPFITDDGHNGARLDEMALYSALHSTLTAESTPKTVQQHQSALGLIVRSTHNRATTCWLQCATIVQLWAEQLSATALFRGVGKYFLHFAIALVVFPLKCVAWLACWLGSFALMGACIFGPAAVGIATLCYTSTLFPEWGYILSGILVAAFLYYNVWCVEPITAAWTGFAEWLVEALDSIWS